MRVRALPAMSWLAASLAGCVINSSTRLPEGAAPDGSRAVLVYAISSEASWDFQKIGIQLAGYDLQRQAITGDCFRFNRTEADMPARPGKTAWFAFAVPPGHYVYSPFNGAGLAGPGVAFEARAGQASYIGAFVLVDRHTVQLRRQLDADRSALHAALPRLPRELVLADAVPVTAPRPFLCTP